MDLRPLALAALGLFASSGAVASAATPATTAHAAQPPAPHAPDTHEHTEFVVETNKLGQVTRAKKVTRSNDSSFNALTYGNALQSFIRTPDGKAISGTYRLTYDYDPRTKGVHRAVALIKSGNVDPNALGAVYVEAAKIRAAQHRALAASAEASALPNLHQMTRHHR